MTHKMNFLQVWLVSVLMLSAMTVQAQTIVGWLETVSIFTGGEQLAVKAKMDSGADHSSLHAMDIHLFFRDGQEWVMFTTVNGVTLEAPLIRYAQIKTKIAGVQKRPVVMLNLCLNGKKIAVEANLVDRQIGRASCRERV